MTQLESVIDVVRKAGEVIETVRRAPRVDVREKDGQGPVTEADRQSDDLLRRELPRITPAAWLSEETLDDPVRLTARRLWVVDPLDGTKEFIAGIPEYAIAVALVEDGAPILGVIHNPATGETFSAARGAGAWADGSRLAVSETGPLLASRSELKGGEFADFEKGGIPLQSMGSIAYKLALVAAGRAAVTLSRGPKWEWDVCAGAILVQEAGGLATDMFGAALRFNGERPKVRGVLAGAPGIHERLRTVLAGVGASARMQELDG